MSDDPPAGQDEEGRDDDPEPRPDDATTAGDEPGEDEERKPISVRDLMPPPASEGRRRAPERRGPAKPAGPPGTTGDEAGEDGPDGEEGSSRPTPVRVAMDAPPPGDSRPARALPSRSFEVDDQEWIVRITGRTVTGTRPDAGALLMHLSFFRASEPESPVRELLTVDRPLEALYSEDLHEFLERARPAREPFGDMPDG